MTTLQTSDLWRKESVHASNRNTIITRGRRQMTMCQELSSVRPSEASKNMTTIPMMIHSRPPYLVSTTHEENNKSQLQCLSTNVFISPSNPVSHGGRCLSNFWGHHCSVLEAHHDICQETTQPYFLVVMCSLSSIGHIHSLNCTLLMLPIP